MHEQTEWNDLVPRPKNSLEVSLNNTPEWLCPPIRLTPMNFCHDNDPLHEARGLDWFLQLIGLTWWT